MQEIPSTQSTGLKVIACSLGSFTKGIGLRVIVGPPSIRWHNRCPEQGGWRCRLSWHRRDCRHAVMGERCCYREEGCPQGARLRLESGRVWAREMLVSRCAGRG